MLEKFGFTFSSSVNPRGSTQVGLAPLFRHRPGGRHGACHGHPGATTPGACVHHGRSSAAIPTDPGKALVKLLIGPGLRHNPRMAVGHRRSNPRHAREHRCLALRLRPAALHRCCRVPRRGSPLPSLLMIWQKHSLSHLQTSPLWIQILSLILAIW